MESVNHQLEDTNTYQSETNPITVLELDNLIVTITGLKDQHDGLKKLASEVWAEYEAKTQEMIGHLQNLGRTEYKSKDYSFSYKEVSNYRVPKSEQDRELFFNYLKEKGLFDDMVGINFATLNSFAAQEEQAAEERGDFDFQIPGLTKSDPYMRPSLRKNRR